VCTCLPSGSEVNNITLVAVTVWSGLSDYLELLACAEQGARSCLQP
jgi:hypothetical protein